MPRDLLINERITIAGWRLTVETTRSGGPGGQHANTTDTAVRIRLHLGSLHEVHPAVIARVRRAFPGYVTSDDELVVACRNSRSQSANLDAAYDRMAEMFRENLRPPKKRRPTKPTKSSQRRRMDEKTKRGQVKSLRGRVQED
jgi:ribosome-associated protein